MAIGPQSHAEGFGTTASGNRSHAEGYSEVKPSDEVLELDVSKQKEAIIEGWNSTENKFSLAAGAASHVEGSNNLALGWCAHTEGEMTLAYANGSHAEGYRITASGECSHAEGRSNIIPSPNDVLNIKVDTEDDNTNKSNRQNIVDHWTSGGKQFSLAAGRFSHVEGHNCLALAWAAHAENHGAVASGNFSHAEGIQTIASG